MSSSTPIPAADLNEFQPIDRFVEEYPQFSLYQLRWLLRSRRDNGLDAHTVKLGRRLYIHAPGFLEWVNAQRNAS